MKGKDILRLYNYSTKKTNFLHARYSSKLEIEGFAAPRLNPIYLLRERFRSLFRSFRSRFLSFDLDLDRLDLCFLDFLVLSRDRDRERPILKEKFEKKVFGFQCLIHDGKAQKKSHNFDLFNKVSEELKIMTSVPNPALDFHRLN